MLSKTDKMGAACEKTLTFQKCLIKACLGDKGELSKPKLIKMMTLGV